MKLIRVILFFLAVSFVIIACSTRPSYVIGEKKMIAIFQDLYLADAIFKSQYEDYKLDEKKGALIDGILQKHNITQAELDSSLVWYSDNIELFTQIQDSANARLQKVKEHYDKFVGIKSLARYTGFSIRLPEYFELDVNNPTLRFRIDSLKLSTFEKDQFKFSFSAKGVDTSQHRVEARVYFRYKDTTIIEKQKILEDGHYEILKPSLNDSLLNEIFGYVHMAMATEQMPKLLLNNITNISVNVKQEGDSTIELSEGFVLPE